LNWNFDALLGVTCILDGMRADGSGHVTLPEFDAVLGRVGRAFEGAAGEPAAGDEQAP
jgi:hypothetical protein